MQNVWVTELKAEFLRVFSTSLLLEDHLSHLFLISLYLPTYSTTLVDCCCCDCLEFHRANNSISWRDKLPSLTVFFLIYYFLFSSYISIFLGEFLCVWRRIYIIRLALWHCVFYRDLWIFRLWMNRSWAFVLWHKLRKKQAKSLSHC